jgi:hypothetical protein
MGFVFRPVTLHLFISFSFYRFLHLQPNPQFGHILFILILADLFKTGKTNLCNCGQDTIDFRPYPKGVAAILIALAHPRQKTGIRKH